MPPWEIRVTERRSRFRPSPPGKLELYRATRQAALDKAQLAQRLARSVQAGGPAAPFSFDTAQMFKITCTFSARRMAYDPTLGRVPV